MTTSLLPDRSSSARVRLQLLTRTVNGVNGSPGCLDDEREAMLFAVLPVRRAAFRRLMSGQAASFEELAATTGFTEESVREAAEKVASVGKAEIDGTHVVGMEGLSTRRTQHCISIEGVDLCTWCAYDIVGIAASLGSDASGTTRCGMCDGGIEVEIRNGDPRESSVVGWFPNETCSNVRAEFCPSALFFCTTEHLDTWRLSCGAGRGEALDLRALAQRGREEWAQLVESSSR